MILRFAFISKIVICIMYNYLMFNTQDHHPVFSEAICLNEATHQRSRQDMEPSWTPLPMTGPVETGLS